MTFVAWRVPVAVLGLLVGSLFLVTGFVFEGVVTASVAALWFLSHAGVPETLGARFLHRKAELEFAKLLVICLLALADIAAIAVGFALHWNKEPQGPVLFAALSGVLVLLMREAEQRYQTFERLMDGGNAEVLVSNELHTLPSDWHIEDNWLRPDGRGNVDHIVGRPDGAWFAVETKSHGFRYRDAAQAVGCAVAVKEARGLPWVVPVLCVDDPNQESTSRRVGRAAVWVVHYERLADWLLTAPPR